MSRDDEGAYTAVGHDVGAHPGGHPVDAHVEVVHMPLLEGTKVSTAVSTMLLVGVLNMVKGSLLPHGTYFSSNMMMSVMSKKYSQYSHPTM